MAEDDDIYELTEDDAVEPTPAPAERRPSAAALEQIEQLDADGQTYALGDEVVPPPRADTAKLGRTPRYCLACSADLTLIDDGICPKCEKPFDPADPKTVRNAPLLDPTNWWLEPPRLAGYAVLPLFLVGRAVVHAVASEPGGRFAEVVIAFAVLASLPWIGVCVYLILMGIEDYLNPKLTVAVPAGMALGVLVTLGLHPSMLFVGAVAGGFTGLLWGWRQL